MSKPVAERAWSQPILWLVLALPAAMVVAGVFMVRSAIGMGSTDATTDRVLKTAQVQTTDLTADLNARDAGLMAQLQLVDGFIEVVPTAGVFARAQPLTLLLRHPIDTRADRVLQMQPDARRWRVAYTADSKHDWLLELRPADGRWRLQGRWVRGNSGARLQSSLRVGSVALVGHVARERGRRAVPLVGHVARASGLLDMSPTVKGRQVARVRGQHDLREHSR